MYIARELEDIYKRLTKIYGTISQMLGVQNELVIEFHETLNDLFNLIWDYRLNEGSFISIEKRDQEDNKLWELKINPAKYGDAIRSLVDYYKEVFICYVLKPPYCIDP